MSDHQAFLTKAAWPNPLVCFFDIQCSLHPSDPLHRIFPPWPMSGRALFYHPLSSPHPTPHCWTTVSQAMLVVRCLLFSHTALPLPILLGHHLFPCHIECCLLTLPLSPTPPHIIWPPHPVLRLLDVVFRSPDTALPHPIELDHQV